MNARNIIRKASAIIIFIIACVTLFMSSSVIFDWFGIRAKEGNYVLFIVWANFISGFFYVAAAYYFFKNNKRVFPILIFVLILLIIAFITLQFHIKNDGIYELKTVNAMIFRMMFTFVFSLTAWFTLNKLK